ncbi:MAG TPA: KH domain-containing protein [Candidatus Sulfotelmatobacter sp.]|nr:KH domain-containing protein [Candidatus Sulfotelmatobacter sp.]
MSEIDQQFIEYVVKSLVGSPDAVKVDRSIDEKGVLLELTVAPEDLGRVIGKRGATAQSLRTLLRALGTKNDARYNLKIIDNGEPRPAQDAGPKESKEEDKPVEQSAPVEEKPKEEDKPKEPAEEETSDRLKQTREELADLDDLDV